MLGSSFFTDAPLIFVTGNIGGLITRVPFDWRPSGGLRYLLPPLKLGHLQRLDFSQ
jgi:hypothetical protein